MAVHRRTKTMPGGTIYRFDLDAVVIVEVSSKKGQKTPALVIERCRDRLRRHDEVTGNR